MEKKLSKLFFSMLFSFVTVICLITVTFAWMTIKNPVYSDNLISQTDNKNVNVEVYCLKNEKITPQTVNLLKLDTKDELNAKLINTKPNDYYSFKVVVTNQSTTTNFISLSLDGIEVSPSSTDISILDYFYLENLYVNDETSNARYKYENSQYDPANPNLEVPTESKFSTLLTGNSSNSINLFNSVVSNSTVTFYFTLSLHFTSEVQNQYITISKIRITSQ